MNSQEIAEQYLKIMNEAFEADPDAVHALICNRVPCNAQLTAHPHIVVDLPPTGTNIYTVGSLGLINGFLASIGDQVIQAKWRIVSGEPTTFIGFQLEKIPNNLQLDQRNQ